MNPANERHSGARVIPPPESLGEGDDGAQTAPALQASIGAEMVSLHGVALAISTERETAMSNPSDNKPFEEFAANVLNRTMCDNCLDEFPDDEMNYDPKVRDGAPVCNECYADWTNDKNKLKIIPATDRKETNPETKAAISDLFAAAEKRISERDEAAQESANVLADAFEEGGDEAARKALEEHLRKYQTSPPDEE